jgi:hypothetical protein
MTLPPMATWLLGLSVFVIGSRSWQARSNADKRFAPSQRFTSHASKPLFWRRTSIVCIVHSRTFARLVVSLVEIWEREAVQLFVNRLPSNTSRRRHAGREAVLRSAAGFRHLQHDRELRAARPAY